MGKNFILMVSAIALIIGFAAMPAYADEHSEGKNAEVDTFRGGEMLNFWGKTNLRLYSTLYEGGSSPYDAFMALEAQAGMSVDMDTVFWSLLLTTAKPADEYNYGKGSSNYVPFYFLSDLSLYIKHAYALWKYNEEMYFALGRFQSAIDKQKDYKVGTSSLTFHPDFAFDGLGFFTNLMHDGGTNMNLMVMLNYLGKFLMNDGTPNEDDTYSHFWMLAIQPQMTFNLEDGAKLNAWLGFWAITHPNQLASYSPTSTSYGTNAIAPDKDANLMLLEAYAKLTMGMMYAWMHIGYNLGAEEQNAGFILGFYHGVVKKPGDLGLGINLFYIDRYMWFDYFVDGTMGAGQRGIQFLINYCFFKNMVFYSVLTFKNRIGGSDTDGQAYFKIGVKVSWKTSGGKMH